MKTLRSLRLLLASVALLALMAGCASERMHTEGMQLLAQGQRDAALAKLKEASRLDPANSAYRIDVLTQTEAYGHDLIEHAEQARRRGDIAGAAELFNKVLAIDPADERARRGLLALEIDVRNNRLLSEADRLLHEGNLQAAKDRVDVVLADDPSNSSAQRQAKLILDQLEKAEQVRAEQAAARSLMRKPVTLQFRDANLRMVFEALSRTTGLNVILDRDVRADLKTTIFVKDAAVEDAVDLILLQTQLEKRSLNASTLFIYPATAAKQKEYQDLRVRTFQVSNVDVKYLQSVLKTVLKVKDVSVDERSGTLVMRDTPDAIAVAEKVIAAHDVPDAEVMLEVQVLEVTHDRLQNLGIEFPNSFSVSTPKGANTLGALRNLDGRDWVTPNVSFGFNFQLQDSDVNLLASPRVRARNKEKAKILIGDRVPIITNTVTPVQSGGSVVTGSVQYQDVGLKLEFEPQIFSGDEVGIRIGLEVSSIAKEIAGPNGSLAYQIGTRNAQTVVRLRDGETQILGGLIQTEDRNTAARLPGVGHLPVVGKLFGNNNGDAKKTEIVLSITPRILRAPALLDASVRSVFSGTEGSTREHALRLDPVGGAHGQAAGGDSAMPPALEPRTPQQSTLPPSAIKRGNPFARPPRAAQPADAEPAPAGTGAGASTTDASTPAPESISEPAPMPPAPAASEPKATP